MALRKALLQVGIALTGAALGSVVGPVARDALGGHPDGADDFGGASCHLSHGDGTLCWWVYLERSQQAGTPGQSIMPIRGIREFVDPATQVDYSQWLATPVALAEQGWRDARGPQWPSRFPSPNDGWVYLKVSSDLPAIAGAITYTCIEFYQPPARETCDSFPPPIDIQWAEVHFNANYLDDFSFDERVFIAAHELGHAFGLDHHDDSDSIMRPGLHDSPHEPDDSIDIGPRTDCRADQPDVDNYGIRCIYGWYETPTPPPGGGGGGGRGSGCYYKDGKCT